MESDDDVSNKDPIMESNNSKEGPHEAGAAEGISKTSNSNNTEAAAATVVSSTTKTFPTTTTTTKSEEKQQQQQQPATAKKNHPYDDDDIDPKLNEVWRRYSNRKRVEHRRASAITKSEEEDDDCTSRRKQQPREQHQDLEEWYANEYRRSTGVVQPWMEKSMDGKVHEIDIIIHQLKYSIWKEIDMPKVVPKLTTTAVGQVVDYRDGYEMYRTIKQTLRSIIKSFEFGKPLHVIGYRSFLSKEYDILAVRDRQGTVYFVVVFVQQQSFHQEEVEDVGSSFIESKSIGVKMYDSLGRVHSRVPFGCLVAPNNRVSIATWANYEEDEGLMQGEYIEVLKAASELLKSHLPANDKEKKNEEEDNSLAACPAKGKPEGAYYPPAPSSGEEEEDRSSMSIADELSSSTGEEYRRKIAYSPVYGKSEIVQALTVAMACAWKSPKIDARISRDGDSLEGSICPTLTSQGWSWTRIPPSVSVRYNQIIVNHEIKDLYVLLGTGRGLSATSYLACDLNGNTFCLKIYLFAHQPMEAAALEVARWQQIYPSFKPLCQQLNLLDGKVCTVLPFVRLIPKKDQEEELKEEIDREVKRIKDLGFTFPHDIVDWRDVSCVVDEATGAKIIVLTNLKSLVKNSHKNDAAPHGSTEKLLQTNLLEP